MSFIKRQICKEVYMKNKIFIMQICFTTLLMTVMCCSFIGISCKLTPEGITILTGDYESPKLVEYSVKNSSFINLKFSKEVKLEDLSIYDYETSDLLFHEEQILSTSTDDLNIDLEILGKTQCGKEYRLCGNANDGKGNSLAFQLKFTGYNENVPYLLISEVRTEYTKGKIEFIELYVAKSGNMSGVEILCANGNKPLNYVFPSCLVEAGEYLVLHCRKMEETCLDELTGNLAECSATSSSDTGRDFWIDNQSAAIGKTDVILLKNRKGGEIIDALLFAETDKNWKDGTDMENYAKAAFDAGVWPSGFTRDDAMCSDGTTVTRTLSRISFPSADDIDNGCVNSKDNWIVTKTSGASPGKTNCTIKYEP